MRLESLTIRKTWAHEKETGYKGEVLFVGPLGKVQLNLNHDLSTRVLAVLAEEVTAASRMIAEELTASVIEQVAETPAIEEHNHDT